MWAALALTTVLNVAPAQQLELKNVRTTYGVLGQERKDNEFLPGDMLVVAFDIDGLKVKDDGRVLYAMGMELVKNEKGNEKSQFKREPQDLEAVNSLGGSTLPCFALTAIGTDTSPGDYTLRVTVKDRGVKPERSKVLTQSFKVGKPRLAFVKVRYTSSAGEPVPPVAVPGQRVYLHCALVGFELDKNKLPDVTFEMSVLDEAGKPTLAKPFKGPIKTDVKGAPIMEFYPMPLELNRSGKFKVTVKAKDNIGGKSTEQSLDLNVLGK
jgi:hypothetical protein